MYLTLFCTLKTLGHEYSYVNMYHREESLFISKKRLGLLIGFSSFLPMVIRYFFRKMISSRIPSLRKFFFLQSVLTEEEKSDSDVVKRASFCSAVCNFFNFRFQRDRLTNQ